MSYELSDAERDGVLASDGDKQYWHFVKKTADWGEVWVINNGDHRGHVTDEGVKLLAAWPHPGFIEGQLVGAWKGFEPEKIEVHDFLDVLDEAESGGMEVAVMPTVDGTHLRQPAPVVAGDLREELERIE
ncbi:DUF2750 domain-containing protein [Baekduia sp. Peel2402]|uniref:DUF2750 domain-containing protein n=1 Tax=Baekduia sp. Peel2402 TaxID=3458296 RepID=UPI00403EF51B